MRLRAVCLWINLKEFVVLVEDSLPASVLQGPAADEQTPVLLLQSPLHFSDALGALLQPLLHFFICKQNININIKHQEF